jgi:SAM-dependent methyltransferase
MVYDSIKGIITKIIPRQTLIDQEERFRKLIYLFYRGEKHQCPVCEKKIRAFVPLKVDDKLCPYCGSPARHRRLWTLLQPLLSNKIKVLDFSPPRCLYRKINSLPQVTYTPTDFAGEFLAATNLDITRLALADNSYDLIICYHVLEHIEADMLAMAELFRVLKPGGCCFIQTPFKDGDIYENSAVTTPAQRLEHFGQDDHMRIYSVAGIRQRLASVGFRVERLDFSEQEDNYYGFRTQETVLVARK